MGDETAQRVFVPLKFVNRRLAKGAIFVPNCGDGVTMTMEQFREELKEGGIDNKVVTTLQFKTL